MVSGVGAGVISICFTTDQPGAYTVSRWDKDGHLDCEKKVWI